MIPITLEGANYLICCDQYLSRLLLKVKSFGNMLLEAKSRKKPSWKKMEKKLGLLMMVNGVRRISWCWNFNIGSLLTCGPGGSHSVETLIILEGANYWKPKNCGIHLRRCMATCLIWAVCWKWSKLSTTWNKMKESSTNIFESSKASGRSLTY